jgi:hypothetical protein
MTESISNFLSLPLWVSIPLTAAYIALWGNFVYILWRYRRR